LKRADRLAYSAIYGSGLGHAYRFGIVVEELLKTGFRIVSSSWGQGYKYLTSINLPSIVVPELDVVWSDEGRMLFKRSIRRFPRILHYFIRQVLTEYHLIRLIAPP
jgi:hypothetical protein